MPRDRVPYQLACGHRGIDWSGFPGEGPVLGIVVTCGWCRLPQSVVWIEGASNVAPDVRDIVEVRSEYDPPKANALLALGWRLLAAGIDAHGFPSLVLGRPSDVGGDDESTAVDIEPVPDDRVAKLLADLEESVQGARAAQARHAGDET